MAGILAKECVESVLMMSKRQTDRTWKGEERRSILHRGCFENGFENAQKEWTLVCTGHNLKRLHSLFNMKKGVMCPVFKIIY
jgi:hypothetical protein